MSSSGATDYIDLSSSNATFKHTKKTSQYIPSNKMKTTTSSTTTNIPSNKMKRTSYLSNGL